VDLPPLFCPQFLDTDGTPLNGGKLYTYVSGTTTPQTTYQDQAGGSANTNPITLDSAGRCLLWLDPTLEYTFVLKRSDLTTVWTKDDVSSSVTATQAVTSVNGETGAVTFDATEIDFTSLVPSAWFIGADVGTALDAIIDHFADITAADISIADAGGLYTATTVEAALQEVAAGSSTQSANGTITFPGGLIMKWGTTASLSPDDATNAVTFDVAFPTNCFMVTGSPSTDNGVTAGAGVKYAIAITGKSTTGFNVVNDGDSATTVAWFAIGN
jgi:hypothetical protein